MDEKKGGLFCMRYEHISQKPYCCVPACVQMVLRRRKLKIPSQAEIAYDLGVVLPLNDRHLLPKSHEALRPKSGWGTRIDIKRYSLTSFFRKRGYSLQEQYFPAGCFESGEKFRKFLQGNIKEGNDLLICFNAPVLRNIEGSWGHATLIEDVEEKFVLLQDPDPKEKVTRKISLYMLLQAAQRHNKGGVWVIS